MPGPRPHARAVPAPRAQATVDCRTSEVRGTPTLAQKAGRERMARAGPRSSAVVDAGTRDHLFTAAYDELRRLAASVRRDDPSRTLSPTALVNEAWLKLASSPDFA